MSKIGDEIRNEERMLIALEMIIDAQLSFEKIAQYSRISGGFIFSAITRTSPYNAEA